MFLFYDAYWILRQNSMKEQPQNRLIEYVYSMMNSQPTNEIQLSRNSTLLPNKSQVYLLRCGLISLNSQTLHSPQVLLEPKPHHTLSPCSLLPLQSSFAETLQQYISDIRTTIDKTLRKIHKLNNLKYSLRYEFKVVRFGKGQYVTRAQQVGREIYLFASGTCSKVWEFSREQVDVPIGSLLGEYSLIGKPEPYTIQVMSNTAYFISIEARGLARTLGSNGSDMMKVKLIEKVREDRNDILKKSITISLQNYQQTICENLQIENMAKRVSARRDFRASAHNQQPQRLYMKYFMESSQKIEKVNNRTSKHRTNMKSTSATFSPAKHSVEKFLKTQAVSRLKTDFKDCHSKHIKDRQRRLKQLGISHRGSLHSSKCKTPVNEVRN